ncbi:MAG: hypothetical protein K2P92_06085, partial [Bdellovibrionaceae bacterium]|nr:hypothetical protein [Pseudobdellovibrionaceae bacterium]
MKPMEGAKVQNGDLMRLRGYFNENAQSFSIVNFDCLYQDTDEVTVFKILAHFSENLLNASSQIIQAVEAQNPEVLWKEAHKLVGTSELLGFKQFAEESRQLSRHVRNTEGYDMSQAEVAQY